MIDSLEYDPKDEIEDLPPFTELEEQQEWNQELVKKNKVMKEHLLKFAEFELDLMRFGYLTYEQKLEKNEILKQYL